MKFGLRSSTLRSEMFSGTVEVWSPQFYFKASSVLYSGLLLYTRLSSGLFSNEVMDYGLCNTISF